MQAPRFSFSFFAPKYWLNWLGLILLYIVSWLPYFLQIALGKWVGRLLYRFFKRRVKIAQINLKMCFPQHSETERERMVKANFEATGIALFESGMGWWWPTWRLKNISQVTGIENIQAAKAAGKGVLVIAHHMVCLEIANRLVGIHNPNIGFYRPHNNALMEWVQYTGRTRNNRYQIEKKDVKGLFSALKNNESIIYLPDQDYGRRRAVFVPFFAEPKACTTTATAMIAKESGCKLVITTFSRNQDNSGYRIHFSPAIEHFPLGDDIKDASRINKLIEEAIMTAPEQYMWLHRRFKTREDKKKAELYR